MRRAGAVVAAACTGALLLAAMRVARLNLIDWHAGGQQPFAHLARVRQVGDAAIGRCQEWIADHYREPAPVVTMARVSGLAPRTFARRFRSATGLAPLEYVHTLRLEEAKHLLETGAASIEAIADEVGYEDAGFFARLFRRRVGLTPAQYRRRFGALRTALAGGTAPAPRAGRSVSAAAARDGPTRSCGARSTRTARTSPSPSRR